MASCASWVSVDAVVRPHAVLATNALHLPAPRPKVGAAYYAAEQVLPAPADAPLFAGNYYIMRHRPSEAAQTEAAAVYSLHFSVLKNTDS